MGLEIAERWDEEFLSPENRKELGQITSFVSKATKYASEEIKRLTGVAVNKHEAERMRKFLPDIETNPLALLSGDTVTMINAKLDTLESLAKKSMARSMMQLKLGLRTEVNKEKEEYKVYNQAGKVIELDDMPKIIKGFNANVIRELATRNPDWTNEQILSEGKKITDNYFYKANNNE